MSHNNDGYPESDDEDLQRALALSLMEADQSEADNCQIGDVQDTLPYNTVDQTALKPPPSTLSQNSLLCHLATTKLSTSEDSKNDRKFIDRDTYSDLTVSPPIVDEATSHHLMPNNAWSAEIYSELNEFHQLMWDSTSTTESDQTRWISQGIDVRRQGKGGNDQVEQNIIVSSNYLEKNNGSLLSSVNIDEFAASHLPWGFLQEHGGPCGVLAAVQAELLRELLFDDDVHGFPQHHKIMDQKPAVIQDALAGAIAIILARAALTPSATAMDNQVNTDTSASSTNSENQMAMETTNESENLNVNDNILKALSPTYSIRIIIPNHPIDETSQRSLDWDDLEPWPILGLDEQTASEMRASSKQDQFSNKLTVYTMKETHFPLSSSSMPYLTLDQRHPEKKHENTNIATTVSAAESNDDLLSAKRQKTSNPMLQTTADVNKQIAAEATYTIDERIMRLAKIAKGFLLDPISLNQPEALAGTVMSEQTEANPLIPLDYFRHHGGVLLLLMSVASSRGIDVVQSEFDDPVGSKLTSTFGHCGQELINLLLTGQAVSNVFDNTLKPPGLGMICRGIQSRPHIGYLSQLEAMRYCEVGTFYKSPKVPIWVVGSTSHFTVLFGERKALSESQSDLLLEKCRRAFKGVDGGEENGFITTQQLNSVFHRLSATYDGKSNGQALTDILDDVKIQTLAASLEVTGAGIILWDDFWKATSRLLTGASFESVVLQANGGGANETGDGDNLLLLAATSVANTKNTAVPARSYSSPNSPLFLTNYPDNEVNNNGAAAIQVLVETDEEMARRLAREWEQESSTTATTITTATTAASASATSSSAVGMSVLTDAVARAGSPMDIESSSANVASAASYSPYPSSTPSTMMLSDEELARKLQAEWDSEFPINSNNILGAGDDSSLTALNGSPTHNDVQNMFSPDGDDDLVNSVLNQIDDHYTNQESHSTPPKIIGYSNPNSGDNGTYNTTSMSTVLEEDGDIELDDVGSSKPAALKNLYKDEVATMSTNTSSESMMNEAENSSSKSKTSSNPKSPSRHNLELEKYGNSFALYHYNGLQGGTLTPFRVTRLTAEEAVGASIALSRSATGGGHVGSSSSNNGYLPIIDNSVNVAQDLEEIVRTKWPSCVIHWASMSEEQRTKNKQKDFAEI